MSSPLPVDVTMYNQWFGAKKPKASSKVVDGKRSKPKPEVEEVLVAEPSASPEVAEVVVTTPEISKEEVETEEERRGRGVFAKLAIPVAAAVAVWAVVAKVAA